MVFGNKWSTNIWKVWLSMYICSAGIAILILEFSLWIGFGMGFGITGSVIAIIALLFLCCKNVIFALGNKKKTVTFLPPSPPASDISDSEEELVTPKGKGAKQPVVKDTKKIVKEKLYVKADRYAKKNMTLGGDDLFPLKKTPQVQKKVIEKMYKKEGFQ